MAVTRLRNWRGVGRGSKERIRARVARVVACLGPLLPYAPNISLTLAMVVIGGLLHYVGPLPPYDQSGPFHLTRHTMDRVLLMIPVVYAGFVFGPRGGTVTLVIVTLLMLPQALFFSSGPADSILEMLSVILVSGLVIMWFGGQRREKERRLDVLRRLELARQELASQVDIISKSERRLSAINEICSVVTESLDLPQVLQRILQKLVEVMDVDASLIFLKDDDTGGMALVAQMGVSPDFARAATGLRIGEGFNGRVACTGEPMVVEDSAEDPRLSIPEVREEGLKSQLIVPLRSKGVIIGTLCVATRNSRRFSRDDIDLLNAVGSEVGISIDNARLYQDARTSEERYRDLFENATVAIFVHDLEGVITAANKAFASLTGFLLGDLLGARIDTLFPVSSSRILREIEEKLLQGDITTTPYDVEMTRKDGARSTVSLTTRLVLEVGRPRGFQHIAIDVTERRRMRAILNYFVKQVLTAQEEERKRIARELHDDTGQSLLLILQRIDSMGQSGDRATDGTIPDDLDGLRHVVIQTLANLRRLTRDLRPQILDDLGLVAAVEWLADDVERQCGIRTDVEVSGVDRQLSPETQLLLFRIIQEALSNVRRHSGASRAKVVLEFEQGKVMLGVEDNGHGFDLRERLSDAANAGTLGLLGMSERARLAGGALTIESQPGKGTKVVGELQL